MPAPRCCHELPGKGRVAGPVESCSQHTGHGERKGRGKLQPSHAGPCAAGTMQAPSSRAFISVLCAMQGLCSHSRLAAFVRDPAPPSRSSGSHPLPGPAPLAERLDTTWG